MKNHFLVCFIIISMMCFSSCSIEHNQSNLKKSLKKEASNAAIMDVIQNKKEFVSSENGKSIYLKDFHSEAYLIINDDGKYEYTTDAESMDYNFNLFSVIDLDSDGYSELLLEESSCGHRLILHYENGFVFGFVVPFRGMENLKEDGSFVSSGGAATNSIGKMKFSKGNAVYNEGCLVDGNIYRMNGKIVSQTEAEKCLNDQDKKENVAWYQYNESNLEKYLTH